MAALLNSFEGDGNQLTRYISKIKKSGIRVEAPDVNVSGERFSATDDRTILFGLYGIKSLGDAAIQAILNARSKGGAFRDLFDFCMRVSSRQVNKRVMENLIMCGAMDSLGLKRNQLMLMLDGAIEFAIANEKDREANQMNLFQTEDDNIQLAEQAIPDVPEYPREKCLAAEKELLGFYVTGHPLQYYENILSKYISIDKLFDEEVFGDGAPVEVAGLVTELKMRVTKKGDSMANLTLEDLNGGSIQVVVFPKTFSACINLLYLESVISVQGRMNVDEKGRQINAFRIQKLRNQGYEFHVKIDAGHGGVEVQDHLKEILCRHRGDDQVFLHLVTRKKVIPCNDFYRVSGDDADLRREVEELLGERTVYVKEM